MVTKLLVNGRTALVGEGSSSVAKLDFVYVMESIGKEATVVGSTLTLDTSDMGETVRVKGKKCAALFRNDDWNMIFVTGTVEEVNDDSYTLQFKVETCLNLRTTYTPGLNMLTPKRQFLFADSDAEANTHFSNWCTLSSKGFYICVDPDDEESIYDQEELTISNDDSVIETFRNDDELYVLWLHRDSVDAEYQSYLGHYKRESATWNGVLTVTRLSPLIPLSSPSFVTMDQVNAAINEAITGAITASY